MCQSSPFLGLIGARFEEDHEEGDDEHLRVAGVVVAGLDERRRTKTPLKRLQIQLGFGAWKMNVLVDHFTH